MTKSQYGFHVIGIILAIVVVGVIVSVGVMVFRNSKEKGADGNLVQEQEVAGLPDIRSFMTSPSDRFLIDYDVVGPGHPFLGKNSPSPHSGAHVHFDGTYKTWPKGGTAPKNYPPIYAVADGVITRREENIPVADHERYGLSLAFAQADGEPWELDYSIEPFVKEPSAGFYKDFMLVDVGDKVKKGQVIAYMYLPNFATGSHIHFHLRKGQGFYPPAIFTPEVVQSFQATWEEFGVQEGQEVPACMGWKLAANENIYENKATECL